VFVLFIVCSCSAPSHLEEGTIYVTKKYVGNHVRTEAHDGYSCVLTTNMIIAVQGYPNVPDSAWCYVRIEPFVHDLHPDIEKKLTKKYFYWYGSGKEYKVIRK